LISQRNISTNSFRLSFLSKNAVISVFNLEQYKIVNSLYHYFQEYKELEQKFITTNIDHIQFYLNKLI